MGVLVVGEGKLKLTYDFRMRTVPTLQVIRGSANLPKQHRLGDTGAFNFTSSQSKALQDEPEGFDSRLGPFRMQMSLSPPLQDPSSRAGERTREDR